jgi:ribonuclease D
VYTILAYELTAVMDHILIQDPASLKDFCNHLQEQPWIALDTEFVRERTFYAQLCLIQIATPQRVACIDPLAIKDLTPLLDLIYKPELLKVIHSARQDLEIFYDLRGNVPTPVFDTQIAAAMLGNDEQIGYAALVESITGVKLAKAHTRANWAMRPLAPEQLSYAADDVRYLRDVYRDLTGRITGQGKISWLEEECARLSDPALYSNAVDHIHLRFKVWREQAARKSNLPRTWVVDDADLLALAQHAPRDQAQFTQIKGLKTRQVSQWGEQIISVIGDACEDNTFIFWPEPTRLTRNQTQTYNHMTDIARLRAQEHQINAALLATRKDIERLILGDPETALLHGWRRAVVGEELLNLMDAEQINGKRISS